MASSALSQYQQVQQLEIKVNLVVGQAAITCCNQVKEIGKHIVCSDMFMVKHAAR
jgi:hypothetical protein